MKVTFIKPNIGRREHSLYIDHGRMEPLMLAVLAGLTPPDVEVRLFDDRMETVDYDEPTDLAAITVETYTARRSYEIAAEYRARGVPVMRTACGQHLPRRCRDAMATGRRGCACWPPATPLSGAARYRPVQWRDAAPGNL